METDTREVEGSAWSGLAEPIHVDAASRGDPPWRDNAFFSVWDPTIPAVCVVHCSTSPNAEGRRARASLWVAGRTAEVVEPLEPGAFSSASISVDLNGRIALDSDGARLHLDFEPRHAVGDFSDWAGIPSLGSLPRVRHFEGCATVRGHMTVGDIDVEVEGHGFRDRTWGFREDREMFLEHFAGGVCLSDFSVVFVKFLRDSGRTATTGFVLSDDARPVREVGLTRTASGLTAELRLTTEDGDEIVLAAERSLAGFWVPVGRDGVEVAYATYDEFVGLRTQGGEQGFGMIEHGVLRRLH